MSEPERPSVFNVHAQIGRARAAPVTAPPPPAPLAPDTAAALSQAASAHQAQQAEIRKQRDEARAQRETARGQRDEARRQRDELREEIKKLNAALNAAASKKGRPIVSGDAAPLTEIDFYAQERKRTTQVEPMRTKYDLGMALSVKEREVLAERRTPILHRSSPVHRTPGRDIAFATVGNDRFFPGLSAMLRSIVDIYPDLESDFHIFHDGTLSDFAQRKLRRIYPNLQFTVPDMDWFEDVPVESDNHKRIGKLGYMNIHGLTLQGYSHVILLDSDLLIIGDLSALWDGDDFHVCLDAGDREYAVRSEYTGDFVFNSGVIGIPGRFATPEMFEEVKALVRTTAAAELCPIIDRFADQKVWNIFLRDKPKIHVPNNYNCNIKYVSKALGGRTEGLSTVHFAGPKPWNDKEYLNGDLIMPKVSKAQEYPALWIDHYRRLTYPERLREYRAWAEQSRRREAVNPDSLRDGRKLCVMMGNGPSMAKTDLDSIRGYERFAFNWFLLHDRFDAIAPEHLMLASHMFYGGWNTQNPAFPEGYLEKLRSASHRPVLWTSFYFRELFEQLGLEKEFEVNYVLYEKPFKRFVDKVGRYTCDIDGFQDDSRTGVLSAALPAAVALGFETVLLVGCDSNYNQQEAGPKYFYDAALHTSPETEEKSLTSTWGAEGRGQFAYKLAADAMKEIGIELYDCTVDGTLRTVPRRKLEDFARD